MGEILKVNELFVSVQGEGPGSGRVATFLRTSGCNLSCSFCDSKYALHTHFDIPAFQVAKAILYTKVPYIIITGGEPLIQPDMYDLLVLLTGKEGVQVDVETNGTCDPHHVEGVRYIVSPKDLQTAERWLNIQLPFVYKFVISPDNMDEILTWVIEHGVTGAYFMPKTCNLKGKWECIVDEMVSVGRMVQSELIRRRVDGILCTRLQNLYRVR